MVFVEASRPLMEKLSTQQENRMKLVIAVLLVGGLEIQVEALSKPGHQTENARYNQDVPITSFFRDYAPDQPAALYDGFAEPIVNIIKQTEDISPNGEFSYSFEADNGIAVEVKGSQKSISPNEGGQVMEGRYSYVSPEGTLVSVQWTADETGFHAKHVF